MIPMYVAFGLARASDIASLVDLGDLEALKEISYHSIPMHSPLCVLEPTFMVSMVVVQVRTSTWCRRA